MLPDDFVRGGYLLDLNRRWAHPLGLEFVLRPTGIEIADYRQERGEPVFDGRLRPDAAEALANVDEARKRRAILRRERLGSVLQGIPGRDDLKDALLVLGLADPEAAYAWAQKAAAELTSEEIERAGETGHDAQMRDVLVSLFSGLLIRFFGLTLRSLAVTPDGDALFAPEAVAQATEDDEKRQVQADLYRRIRALGRQVLEGQEAGDAPVLRQLKDLGVGGGVSLAAELYPAEVEELRRLLDEIEQIQAQERGGQDVAARKTEVAVRIEELYGLAQPGMRYWRGDKAARKRFAEHREAFREAVDLALSQRSQYQQLVLGHLPIEDIVDVPDVIARLARESETVRAELEEATKTYEDTLSRYERLSGLLSAVGAKIGEREK